jgi:hypothetical protein
MKKRSLERLLKRIVLGTNRASELVFSHKVFDRADSDLFQKGLKVLAFEDLVFALEDFEQSP